MVLTGQGGGCSPADWPPLGLSARLLGRAVGIEGQWWLAAPVALFPCWPAVPPGCREAVCIPKKAFLWSAVALLETFPSARHGL